jgi:hypothetical protein
MEDQQPAWTGRQAWAGDLFCTPGQSFDPKVFAVAFDVFRVGPGALAAALRRQIHRVVLPLLHEACH